MDTLIPISAGTTGPTASRPAWLDASDRRASFRAARRARRHDGRGREDTPVPVDLNFAWYTASERHDRLAAAASRQRFRRRRRP